MSIANIFVKLLMSFSGWRLSIIYKMKEINLLNLPGKKSSLAAARSGVVKKKETKTRPIISYNRNTETSLRFLDGGL